MLCRPHDRLFLQRQVRVLNLNYDFYFRDILECVKALFGDPDFAAHLVFVPERHYLDENRTQRLYHDMHTGYWWWDTQVCTLLNCYQSYFLCMFTG